MLPIGLSPRPVELSFNWQDVGKPTADFTYYDDLAFRVRRVHPLGGPAAGGTLVHVYLFDDRLLVNLAGEGVWGPTCRFAGPVNASTGDAFSWAVDAHSGMTHLDEEESTLNHTEPLYHQDVKANLTNCNGKRACGNGWAAMSCVMPEWAAWTAGQAPMALVVEVSINGQDFSSGGFSYLGRSYPKRTFTIYDPAVIRIDRFTPLAGPHAGGTHITVHGRAFRPFGDVRCQFGPFNLEVNATVISSEIIRCMSPPSWRDDELSSAIAGFTSEPLEVTLNGQDYLPFFVTERSPTVGSKHPGRRFTHFSMDSLLGLSVSSISPLGGPPLGGTRTTVTGTGFDRFLVSNSSCSFGSKTTAVVPASVLDRTTVVCDSPPLAINVTNAGHAVDVEFTFDGGQPLLFTNGHAAQFLYHHVPTIASIHPKGGERSGGTNVTVSGTGFRELDRGQGLQCHFVDESMTPFSSYVSGKRTTGIPASITVPAYIPTGGASTSAFDASETIYCVSPPLDDLYGAGGAEDVCIAGLGTPMVSIYVTNNRGDAVSADSASFTYIGVLHPKAC